MEKGGVLLTNPKLGNMVPLSGTINKALCEFPLGDTTDLLNRAPSL